MRCNPRQLAGNVMRNIAALLTITAEKVDPQPPIPTIWPFTIQNSSGTRGAEAHITWHETA